MRLSGATTCILFLTLAVGLPWRPARAEAPPAPAPSGQGGEDPAATHPADPSDPPLPPPEEAPAADGTGDQVAPTDLPLPVLPGIRAVLTPPGPAAVRKEAPKQDLPDTPEPRLPEPPLPEDGPPASDNELTAGLGWNSDTPVGLRYLRRMEGTVVSFGLGLGLVTLWGPKLSAIIRFQPSFERGFFAQLSAGYTLGGSFTAKVAPAGGKAETVHLVRTPSRTADVMVGWRLPVASNFVEASAGYSFNLQGTVLQEPMVDGHTNRNQVPLDVNSVPFNKAGGIAGAVSYGWLF